MNIPIVCKYLPRLNLFVFRKETKIEVFSLSIKCVIRTAFCFSKNYFMQRGAVKIFLFCSMHLFLCPYVLILIHFDFPLFLESWM